MNRISPLSLLFLSYFCSIKVALDSYIFNVKIEFYGTKKELLFFG